MSHIPRRSIQLLLAALLIPFLLRAEPELRAYTTQRLTTPAPAIDGKLEEACWTQGEWSDAFVQREPHEGAPAAYRTELKILYDDHNLYVAIRAHDPEITTIPHLRARRDELAGDVVGIAFDSYADRRSAFEFALTLGGNQYDAQLRNWGGDSSWNAVWKSGVDTGNGCWTAEFRIPFSQLRHNGRSAQVWGLHGWRWIPRLQERSNWQLIPMDNAGLVYSFGELRGLRDLPTVRRLEIVPYTVAKLVAVPDSAGNPLLAGSSAGIEAGLDLKLGLSSGFTLTATANPDFSQLEADPSELNLSSVETFYSERRPFFLEGKNTLEFGLDADLLFYSRRLGRQPSLDPDTSGHEAVPPTTRILAATKVTGQTEGGLSLGVLHSLTARETALLEDADGTRRRVAVEPRTNYFTARLQQDLGDGATLLGATLAATLRDLDAPELHTQLARSALTGGLDFRHTWGDRAYFVDGRLVASRIEGAAAALRTIGENGVHYFQRPDADYLPDDPAATSLSGTGGRFFAGKDNGGRWRYSAGLDWRTPGLELNDLGYLQSTDFIRQTAHLEYVRTEPSAWFRRYNTRFTLLSRRNFGGDDLGRYARIQGGATFPNNWSFWGQVGYTPPALDQRLLRGGPAVFRPARYDTYVRLGSDSSRPWQYWLGLGHSAALDGSGDYRHLGPGLNARFGRLYNVELKLNYEGNRQDFQYAGDVAPHYLVGRMRQETLGATLNFSANLTPSLTLSYYANPYVTNGRFRAFLEAAAPRDRDAAMRFRQLDPVFDPVANRYTVLDPTGAYTFDNPDFTWRDLKSSLVLRWDYRPGSTLHLVWSYAGNSSDLDDRPLLDAQHSVFRLPATNTLLLKFSYWFSG